ncbi:MAG: M48 family metallopeptidase [Candidatus Omnitrophota bacterium]
MHDEIKPNVFLRPIPRSWALALAGVLLCGCATIYNPATERQEFIFITTPMEVALGNNVAMSVAKEYKFIKTPEVTDRVSKLGEKIAKVSDRQDLKYHFAVVEDKEINAFTTPGGYVYINSGLIDMVSDDELACVIGHEIGHIAARHITKKLQAQLGYDILMNIALQKASVNDLQQAASITFNLVSLGYSREDELLADRLGAKYAYKAGYDPYAMITFLKKLKDIDKEEMGFVFLRSHPYTSKRIEMMEKQMPAIIAKVDGKPVQGAVKTVNPTNEGGDAAQKPRPYRVMCPKCRKIFSGNVRYCPYDGTRL